MEKPKMSLNTKLLGIASFFVDISSEMIYPLLPFFLTTVLAGPVFVLGLMESLAELIVSITGIISGLYSDKIGKRKKIIIFGYSISALFKILLFYVATWPQLLLLRSIERIGKGVRDVPRDALIGLSEEKSNLGKAFGFRKFLDNAGAIIGPLLATVLISILYNGTQNGDSYRAIFLISVIPAAIAVLFLLFLKDHHTEKTPVKKIVLDVFRTGQFRQFMVSGIVFSLGHFSMMFFLLRSNDFVPLVLVPVLYLVYNSFYTLFSMPAGILADKLGAKKLLLTGMCCFLIAVFGFAFFPSLPVIFACFAFIGFFMAIAETAPQVLLIKTTKDNMYASAIGAYKGVSGMIAFPANLIAGVLYTVTIFGSPGTFVFSIITTAVAVVLLAVLVKE